jgi:hypothetical protein
MDEGNAATTDEERPPASAAESLRLIREQRVRTERSIRPDPRLIYWPWAVAWFVGFGLLFLAFGAGGGAILAMPVWLPLTTLFTLMVVAQILTTAESVRTGRHVPGQSSVKGLMYGLSWPISFAALSVTLSHASDFLPPAQIGLLWAAGSMSLVAALHLAGAAVWCDRTMFAYGTWLALINIGGVVAGPGWHSLVISVGGGVGGFVTGLASARIPERPA